MKEKPRAVAVLQLRGGGGDRTRCALQARLDCGGLGDGVVHVRARAAHRRSARRASARVDLVDRGRTDAHDHHLSRLQTHLPIGVRMTVARETKEDETRRYIPDLLLKAKQDELKALDDPVTRKKLGWE